ncbi:nucleoside-diphosphate kinase [Paenibacillus xylanexedens]|uniref:Nucleoside diphosphate kinase n=1 Tax=Paenibacillus xylanexedens TaxID=528191 RepID=A0ABS4RSH9_PAEXY|nr:nucleoside-diphosphate kinase [Paenibacillus xylanexedens]MBP2245840.1 nucleoside diphosphate kinase [Paenibacillus xylanexedens]
MDENDFFENTLLLVKPDGIEKNLTNIILSYLDEQGGLKEVHRNTFRLSVSQVSDTFIHLYNDRNYKSYMTRGEVTAVLLRGKNAVQKLRNLKSNIRKMYANDAMQNIIHSSEVGNEFDLQFRTFFPHLDINHYNMYADLYSKTIFPMQYENFCRKVELIEKNASVKVCAHIFNNDIFPYYSKLIQSYYNNGGFKKFTFIGLEYNTVVDNINIKVLGYYKLNESLKLSKDHDKYFYSNLKDLTQLINQAGGTAFFSYTNQLNQITKEILEKMSDIGIRGGVVYHPQYTLAQTEFLRENILACKMITTGGSGGITQSGRFSVSYEIFNQLFNLLYGEDYFDYGKEHPQSLG